MARRFITDKYKLENDLLEIYQDEAKHISILRHKRGDIIEINDYICEITDINKNKISLKILGQAERTGIPHTKITLYQAILKGDKMEYVIQKSIELGVSSIVPFISKNVVVKIENKDIFKKSERWNKISKEATKQCGRSDIVNVENIIDFKDMSNSLKKFSKIIIAYEHENKPLKEVLKTLNKEETIAIIIGSEGGFEKEEKYEILKNKNAVSVSLGERILRAETASLNLISVLNYELDN